jgi:hypothetical protein
VSPVNPPRRTASRSHATAVVVESKLTRVMDGFQKLPDDTTGSPVDPDELPNLRFTTPHDDDEGLHLMYGYPRPTADGTPSAQPFPSSSQLSKVDGTPDVDASPSHQRTIRFRSRVRIASGVHSVSSSPGSRSSSISVPLQGPHGPHVSANTSPLSEMLPAAAANVWLRSVSSSRRASSDRLEIWRNSASPRSSHVDERTPFASRSRRSYTEQTEDEAQEEGDAELERLQAATRKSEEQVMFGKWPWRILNRHVRPHRLSNNLLTFDFLSSGGGGKLNLSYAAVLSCTIQTWSERLWNRLHIAASFLEPPLLSSPRSCLFGFRVNYGFWYTSVVTCYAAEASNGFHQRRQMLQIFKPFAVVSRSDLRVEPRFYLTFFC